MALSVQERAEPLHGAVRLPQSAAQSSARRALYLRGRRQPRLSQRLGDLARPAPVAASGRRHCYVDAYRAGVLFKTPYRGVVVKWLRRHSRALSMRGVHVGAAGRIGRAHYRKTRIERRGGEVVAAVARWAHYPKLCIARRGEVAASWGRVPARRLCAAVYKWLRPGRALAHYAGASKIG